MNLLSISFYILLILNILITFKKKKSNFIAVLFLIIIFMAFAGNNRTGFSDNAYYRIRYDAMLNYEIFTDVGYSFFADYFSSIGIPFNAFLAIIFTIVSLLIYLGVKELDISYNSLLSLYSLFYLFFHMEGLRFLLASSFCLYGLLSLAKERRTIAIIFIILGFFFHKSIIFVLPFVFIYKCNNEKYNKKIFIFFVLIFIGLTIGNFLFRNIIDLFSYFMNFFSEDLNNSIKYYAANNTRYGSLLYFAYYIYNYIAIYNIRKLYTVNVNNKNTYLYKIINMSYYKCLYSTAFLPLIILDTTFFRFTLFDCNLVFICFSSLLIYLFKRKIIYKKNLYLIIIMFILFTVEWWILKVNVLSMHEELMTNIFW